MLICAPLCPFAAAWASFSFDDIEFWVGSGANRAAVVTDWVENDAAEPALAWGYRWDGAASGRDMLLAVVAADDRLFAKLGDSPQNPIRVFGLGYDADDDGQFAIDDGTQFDADGFAYSGPADVAMASDAGDLYGEGWFTGFWHYGVAASNPFDGGAWSDIPVGMASRVLTDGAWDSWVFSPSFDFASFAENPRTAAAPATGVAGDFNSDGMVDAADYDVWKAAFGSQTLLAADANRNGIVDAADYTVWRDHLGAGASPAIAQVDRIPESAAIALVLIPIALLRFNYVRFRIALKERHVAAQGVRKMTCV